MNQSSFYLTLPSNVKSLYTETENTVANYITPLARPINLTDDWEVGMSEIIYTKSWFNIKRSAVGMLFSITQPALDPADPKLVTKAMAQQNVIKQMVASFKSSDAEAVIRTFAHDPSKYIMVPGRDDASNFLVTIPASYETVELLIKMLNNMLAKQTNMTTVPKIDVDDYTGQVYIKPGVGAQNQFVYPVFSQDIEDILDIKVTHDWLIRGPSTSKNRTWVGKDTTIRGLRALDINAGRHVIYVYSDIVTPSLVGDANVQLLRVVGIPHEQKFGQNVVITYQNPQYHNVLPKSFNSVEIDFKFDTNERVPFEFGRTIVTLHFRKKL